MQEESCGAFCYGTLMVPGILSRVIGRDLDGVTAEEAIIYGCERRKVKRADYPAALEVHSPAGADNASTSSILGVLYRGLTKRDILLLDKFEGDEYVRQVRRAHLIKRKEGGPTRAVDGGSRIIGTNEFPSTLEAIQAEGRVIPTPTSSPTIAVSIYLWCADELLLEPEPWDFEQFKRDKMHAWVASGSGAEDARWAHRQGEADQSRHSRGGSLADEYAEVDDLRRQLDEEHGH